MFKKLSTAYILSFVVSFMIWIYEPITMYANNIEDLWFSFKIVIGPLLLLFVITFIILSIIYTLIYYINNKYFFQKPIYSFSLIVSFIAFFALYIQGNFLIYNLPPLDGTMINWSSYKVDKIISLVLWVVLIIVSIILIKKIKIDKTINIYKCGSFIILAMLFVSLLSTFLTTDIFRNKEILEFTMNNFDDASTNKNFYIFLVDAVDSVIFDEVLNKSEYKDTFNDFSYYKDTMSGYPFTRDSIPFIFSGNWNENKTDFITYFNKSMDESSLLNSLREKKYNINLYDQELIWFTDVGKKTSNISSDKISVDIPVFARQEVKYFIYKYFPYFLKKYSYIDTMDFNNRTKYRIKNKVFEWKNNFVYEHITNNKINKIEQPYFSFIHTEGAHVPFDMDENLNPISNGTYYQKIGATIKTIDAFIHRLKENDVYDNSVIIVMADHGYSFIGFEGRQNPLLLIKGIDEHHDLYYSDIPISHEDLKDAYKDLIDDKKSIDLFENISKDRKRRYMWYKYLEEDHMVEYEQFGKAWNEETLKPTGKEFNR